MRLSRRFLTFVIVAFGLGVHARASADPPRVSLDWSKLSDAIREGGVSLLRPRESPRAAERNATGDSPTWRESQRRWIGLSPDFSLVARDWGGAQLLAGELSVTDTVRVSRSIRMVVTRVRLAQGRISPFAQIGMGQWRTDTDLMPALPRDTALATQFGAGFDLRVSHAWSLALECDQTLLYRGSRGPDQASGPHLWGGYVAMKGTF